jgi:hypothetical protein
MDRATGRSVRSGGSPRRRDLLHASLQRPSSKIVQAIFSCEKTSRCINWKADEHILRLASRPSAGKIAMAGKAAGDCSGRAVDAWRGRTRVKPDAVRGGVLNAFEMPRAGARAPTQARACRDHSAGRPLRAGCSRRGGGGGHACAAAPSDRLLSTIRDIQAREFDAEKLPFGSG